MEKKKLILFDLDGTIAESNKKAYDAILITLAMNKDDKYEYGIVSGGCYDRISEQVGLINIKDDKEPLFNYVFCENGMIGYKNNTLLFKKDLKEKFNDNEILEVEKLILDTVSKNITIYQDTTKKIERRNSLWYFAPCGIGCNDKIRNDFIELDKKENIRTNIINILKDDLLKKFNLEIKLGGNIGLSIYPKGWGKSYIIKNKVIDKEKYSKIYFFGDKCQPNGNDFPLYNHPDITGIEVKKIPMILLIK